jgi:MscS family membrane protein
MRVAPQIETWLALAELPPGASREWLAGIVAALLVLALAFLVSFLVGRVGTRVARQIAARTTTDVDDKILDIIEKPLRKLILVIGMYLAVLELPLPGRIGIVIAGIFLIYVALVAVRLATQLSLTLLVAYGHRVDDEIGKERFEKDYLPLLSKVLGAVFFVVALIYVLHHFGQNVSSLVAALGIGTAAVGLAARETLANMFAGFVILIDRPFRPGDRIKLVSGDIADVVEVGTRSTRLRLLDQNALVVPNNELVNSRVINLSYPAHPTQATLELRVAYGSDLEAVKALVLDTVKAQPEVVAEPPPGVLFTAFGDHALVLTLTYVISQFADAAKAQEKVRLAVYRRFSEAGVKIPFPTREIVDRQTVDGRR